MRNNDVRFLWQDPGAVRRHTSGVCLHGHTMYSQECLWFLPRYLRYLPFGSQIVRRYEQPRTGPAVDFARAYWTPPLSPASALQLEQRQIEDLGLQPMVSLTDHDDIEAGISLQVTANRREVPVSVEWTVPYAGTYLHFGIHNLPPDGDRAWMNIMAGYTACRREQSLPDLLRALSAIPEVLIVLNHPFWLEEGVDESTHRLALARVLRECVEWIHAFELNGTRGWKENSATVALAAAQSRPVVSGGDRHACEPSACVNLTRARTFSEFVAEIKDGHSSILFLPHYREPMAIRILETGWDVLRNYPEYPGRERWIDRFFYRGEDGVAQPLAALWKDEIPWMLHPAKAAIEFFATTKVRQALRLMLMSRGKILP